MSGDKFFQFLFLWKIFISHSFKIGWQGIVSSVDRYFFSFKTWTISLHSHLAHRDSDEKSPVNLVGNPPKVVWHLCRACFRIFFMHYCWKFDCSIVVKIFMVSAIMCSVCFLYLDIPLFLEIGKVFIIISPNMPSKPFSFHPWNCILGHVIVSHKFPTLSFIIF